MADTFSEVTATTDASVMTTSLKDLNFPDLSPQKIGQSVRPLLEVSLVVFVYFWVGFVAGQAINALVVAVTGGNGEEKTTSALILEVSAQVALTNVAVYLTRRLVRAQLPKYDLDNVSGVSGGGVLLAVAMLSGQSRLTENLKKLQQKWILTPKTLTSWSL